MKKTNQFIQIEYKWMELIGSHDKEGESIEVNHAMLLFIALINNLSQNPTDKHPTCYASNEYFANTLHVSESAISKYLKKLKKLDLIKTHEERPKGSSVTKARYIYIQWNTIDNMIGAQSTDVVADVSSDAEDAGSTRNEQMRDADDQKGNSKTVTAATKKNVDIAPTKANKYEYTKPVKANDNTIAKPYSRTLTDEEARSYKDTENLTWPDD